MGVFNPEKEPIIVTIRIDVVLGEEKKLILSFVVFKSLAYIARLEIGIYANFFMYFVL
jgi:hypothetical protein